MATVTVRCWRDCHRSAGSWLDHRGSGQKHLPQHAMQTATPMGFEPTRAEPIGLAGRRLNHSAKVSWKHQNQCPSLRSLLRCRGPSLRCFRTVVANTSMCLPSERSREEVGWPLVTNKEKQGGSFGMPFVRRKKNRTL